MVAQQEPEYRITRSDLEEFYDSLVHVCGKEYADNVWAVIETRSHGPIQHNPEPEQNNNDPCISCQVFLRGASYQCDRNPCAKKIVFSREEHDAAIAAKAREEGAKQEREQMLCLSDKDKERIAAAMAVATFCSGIPEVFDTIQLNCNAPNETAASYAKAMLVILDNTSEWCDLIDRLSTYTNGNISLRQSQSTEGGQ